MQELMLVATYQQYQRLQQAEREAEAKRERLVADARVETAPEQAPASKRRPLLPRLAATLGLA